MTEELVERTFNVPSPARVSINNVRGSVVVLPGSEAEISVKAVKHLGSGDAENTEILIEQDAAGDVRVETRNRSQGGWFLNEPCKVDYEIRAPRNCSAHINVVSASARLEGLSGEQSVRSVSGNIAIADLAGELKLNSVSGNLSGQGLAGQLKLDTVSGDVALKNCRLTTVNGSTVSGNLAIELEPAQGPYQFKSVSGDVTLSLPAGSGCTLRLTTMSGRIQAPSAQGMRSEGRGKHHATFYGGGPAISLNSVSGDLRLRYRNGEGAGAPAGYGAGREAGMDSAGWNPEPPPAAPAAPPAPGEPAVPAEPAPSVSEVLDRIERGEISVDEALKQLGVEPGSEE